MSTIVVAGALANKLHNGGEAWVRLSWVLGFERLGCRVHFLEEIASDACVDSHGAAVDCGASENLEYFRSVTRRFGLEGRAALLEAGGTAVHGARLDELLDLAAEADLLVNISGNLSYRPLLERFRRKAFVDIDPGFTQFWHAQGVPGGRVEGHDFYFTIGENIGTPGCSIPVDGIRWRPTRQPVVLDEWPVEDAGQRDRFTTIANWRGPYGPITYEGRTFALKVHEFRRFLDLPSRSPHTFEVALNIHPSDAKDLTALEQSGWNVVDPRPASSDPEAFRSYVQGSGAEFTVAQGVYVHTGSGWFSDRTIRYLASGKPVLVQDTGFGRQLPTGEGLLAFRTVEEAVAGAGAIQRDYDHHARAARALAEEYFDSDRVLGRLLEETAVRP